ncbi:hypothetical protein FAF44_17985 [Nonomuraea sp. MG754425]|uniref:hypothetical protein n=1 Tax=Nonomuraea sp. MG754425 TaxID=2570319 RepID=UPI001F299D60|nr:hypothetical protein [Nonomuraea sp. MG754425]MCF6470274.1 hypothetical protein [Nonomuraea sp. MG754425]
MTTTRTVSFGLGVHYGQAYLVDDTDDNNGYANFAADHPDHPVGIIRVEDGAALLLTGTHTGTLDFSATVADQDPGADTDGYEDIVEISLQSEAGRLSLCEWGGGGVHEIPELPSGPGWYRLRYHAVDMDEESEAEDRYLLQIWPQPESVPQVVKSTSAQLAYWRSAG